MAGTQPIAEDLDGAEGRDGRAAMTAGRACATVVLALALAAVLAAPSLERVAERQPYGIGRDVALLFARPLATLSHALLLDRPREWLASLTNHEDPPTAGLLLAKKPPVQPATTAAPSSAASQSGPPSSGATPIPGSTMPVSTVTFPVAPVHRAPTQQDPLRIWMGGDSLMGTVSEAFGRLVAGDSRVRLNTDVQVGTGLARPDVLDWANELTAQLDATKPDIVFLSFGGNDDQPMMTPDGSTVRLYTPEWDAEYSRRIGLVMDIASARGTRTVVWLGLPSERPEQLNNVKDAMNSDARTQAKMRFDVHFVDLGSIFDGPGATYSDDIQRPDGTTVRARARDGVHLTAAGADVLAPHLYDVVAGPWHLR